MTVIYIIVFGLLLLISIYDCIYYKIPNTFLLLLFGVVCFYVLTKDLSFCMQRILSALLFVIIFFAIKQITRGLGYGDIKLLFVTCVYFGLQKSFFALLFASVSGIIFYAVMYICRKGINKIPFSPFIVSGYLLFELAERLIR